METIFRQRSYYLVITVWLFAGILNENLSYYIPFKPNGLLDIIQITRIRNSRLQVLVLEKLFKINITNCATGFT